MDGAAHLLFMRSQKQYGYFSVIWLLDLIYLFFSQTLSAHTPTGHIYNIVKAMDESLRICCAMHVVCEAEMVYTFLWGVVSEA